MSAALPDLLQEVEAQFVARHPAEVAYALETRPVEEALAVLRGQPADRAAEVLQRMAPDVAAEALHRWGEDVGPVLAALDPARAAALLSRLDEDERRALLDALPGGLAREVDALLTYPRDSAGHTMDPRVNVFHLDDRVRTVQERLVRLRERRIHDVFLVDADGRLLGSVGMQDLALADPDDRLEGLARGVTASVQATASREEVLEELARWGVSTLPVVDFEGRVLGVIRHAALVAAAQEEASVDLQTMVGASKDERALSSPLFAVRKRLPWLQINLLTAFLAASVVGLFESTIARYTALAVLLPVVAGQSGNTGSQALAVTMRGLALREVRARHWWRVASKELTAASINGVAVGLTTALGVYVWSGSTGLALVIGVSMVISMALAGLSGASIPMVLTSLGQDPAQSSSIILTTVTDVVGFFSFLGIATALASML